MVSRRAVLRGATGLAAATPLALAFDALAADGTAEPAPAGSTRPEQVPDTLAHRRTRLASGDRVAETAFPLTHLGLSWSGTAAAVRLRTRSGWGEWHEARGCPGGRDAAGRPGANALLPASGAVGYELRVTGGGAARAVELNTVDGPARTAAAPAGTLALPGDAASGRDRRLRLRLPRYLSRPAWGADESYRLNPDGTVDTPPVFIPVQTLTVHHSGFDDDQPDAAATVRAIYYDQAVVKDWGDIGYQLVIDADGNVYEGTYSDPDPVPVFGPDLGADGRPQMVNGAHVGGFNSGNIGVVLLGDYTARQPTAAARRSLTVVLALLASACRLEPTGTTDYVNPISGVAATIATISGHRDWHFANPIADPTLCPGDRFHPELPELRRDVADLLDFLGR